MSKLNLSSFSNNPIPKEIKLDMLVIIYTILYFGLLISNIQFKTIPNIWEIPSEALI